MNNLQDILNNSIDAELYIKVNTDIDTLTNIINQEQHLRNSFEDITREDLIFRLSNEYTVYFNCHSVTAMRLILKYLDK